MSLKVTVTRGAPLATAVLHGALDRDSARVLRLKAQSLLATGHRFLVLDLTQLTGIDEAGVDVIVYARRIYRLAGAALSLVGAGVDLEDRIERLESRAVLAAYPA